MSLAIQLVQSAAWLGQMAAPPPFQQPALASPFALILILAILACGFLSILLAAIFGRWKLLGALLVCGVLGTLALAFVGYLLVIPTPTQGHNYESHMRTEIAYGPSPVVARPEPIELPASATKSPPSQATVAKAVGSALFDTLVKPAVDTVQDAAGKSTLIPPGRPEWVDQEPQSDGGVDYVSLSTGPYTSSTECYKTLKSLTREAVEEQTAQLLGSETRAQRVPLDDQFIADNVHLQTYKESLDTTVGTMQQWHAHLQFNDQFRNEVEKRWLQVQQSTRLTYAGTLFAGVLAVLGVLYGALSYDTATSGQHRGRLQTVAGAAILGIVGGAILLTQWFPPV